MTTSEDGWIEWNGGECPVGPGAVVEIELSGGLIEQAPAAEWDWSWDSADIDSDIIAYRLVKPS